MGKSKAKPVKMSQMVDGREFIVKDGKTVGAVYFCDYGFSDKWNLFALAFIEIDKKANKRTQKSIVKLLGEILDEEVKRESSDGIKKIERILKTRYKMTDYKIVHDFIPQRRCARWVRNLRWGSSMKQLWGVIEPMFREQIRENNAKIAAKEKRELEKRRREAMQHEHELRAMLARRAMQEV